MDFGNLFNVRNNGLDITGSNNGEVIFGSFRNDIIDGKGGNDILFGLFGNDYLAGGLGDDKLFGGFGRDLLTGGEGEDSLWGGNGNDILVGNKGDDAMFGGNGNDLLIWNNGDGSDLMNGGRGHDRVQVNFNTDLVNDDLQNKDVAEFSATQQGVQFARVELNDQDVNGLFQLDIRKTETLETNFGGGDDAAKILDDVLEKIKLELDGGDGIDLLDFSKAAAGVDVDLAAGKAGTAHVENFENVIGSEFDDAITGDKGANVISGLGGVDHIDGGKGKDVLIGNKGDDFVFGGKGNDLLVWNNGDGSDLMDGGRGRDRVQVNFDTDLVNDDLQNKDVAEFSVTPDGVQFARVELNDQNVNGLFQLDIRETEKLETNFGDGDDAAKIVDDVLDQIKLDLDGGDGTDLLDFSKASAGVDVDLGAKTAGTAHVKNFENVIGSEFDDAITGDKGANVISGLGGVDNINGGKGDDVLIGNKGDDFIFGEKGDDLLVWNNGDGSDLMNGGDGYDRVQVNFDTDLVNDDLQNKDVAEFSVTPDGVQFARVEVNDQNINGLFQLDIRETEKLETNFGGGDDTARIVDDVLDQIKLDLDGGDGTDLLDFSQASAGVEVDLAAGAAGSAEVTNFENVNGSDFDDRITGDDGDNVIRGGSGNDTLTGGEGADTFVFVDGDEGIDTIVDFEFGVDRIVFLTEDEFNDPDVIEELGLGGAAPLPPGVEEVPVNALVNDGFNEDFLLA